MAGYHLGRNKMFFFSGALFITLADWSKNRKVKGCDFENLGSGDVKDLLNGSWVVVAGDSQARLLVQSLLSLILNEKRMGMIMKDLFKRHNDYEIVVDDIGMKLDFFWAPYMVNLTNLMVGFKQNRTYPDVLVIGARLWHMLHVNNASDYDIALENLRSSVVSLLPFLPELSTDGPVTGSVSVRSPHLFWLGMSMLINEMLNTKEKREKRNDQIWHAYYGALHNNRILRSYGGPLLLLEI
ncbi:hypothetical protein NC652_010446 [Populus alba x Populus x berolinensis]|nr:hypothetical protein NC652_010446 [Populus alba x Populus x berolinensis]